MESATKSSLLQAAAVVARKGRKKRSLAAAATAVVVASSALPSCLSLNSSPHFHKKAKQGGSPTSSASPEVKKATKKTIASSESQSSRTQSFGPRWAGSVLGDDDGMDPSGYPSIHTLVLGTHPSVKSLGLDQYYAHPQNAFWWIAGDCLGFRRAAGLKADGKTPFALAQHLRYGPDKILPTYDDQLRVFVSHGFALWDVVGSCVRPGSLDSDITMEQPNDIRGFVEQHAPNVKRIVFASGRKSCELFCKHFRDWWMDDDDDVAERGRRQRQLVPGSNPESIKAFERLERAKAKKLENAAIHPTSASSTTAAALPPIECICALSVSPAAATYTYLQKREFWETHVYKPGLDDYWEEREQRGDKRTAL